MTVFLYGVCIVHYLVMSFGGYSNWIVDLSRLIVLSSVWSNSPASLNVRALQKI